MSKIMYVIFDLDKKDYVEKEIELGENFNLNGVKRVLRAPSNTLNTELSVLHGDDPTFYPIKHFLSYCGAYNYVSKNAVTKNFEVIVIN